MYGSDQLFIFFVFFYQYGKKELCLCHLLEFRKGNPVSFDDGSRSFFLFSVVVRILTSTR